jgi:prepilin-type N-terminal cleavage/methylation domain-containing protein
MKQSTPPRRRAFVLIELMIVLLVLALAAALLLPALAQAKSKAQRISCVNNLKQISIAYRIWEADNGDLTPAAQTARKGGWADCLAKPDQGALCWTNFAIMANELGQSPKLLNCPSDERQPAANFARDFKDNSHLSYFVGVSASDLFPLSIQSGDRNLGPGADPGPDYGYSPASGKGNDVAVATDTTLNPVCWSLKMHSNGNPAGAGNISLGDGSAQQVSSASFSQNFLSHADPTPKWPAGHAPASPSIRLVFP